MKTLTLSLNKEWFDMIKSGEKKEESTSTKSRNSVEMSQNFSPRIESGCDELIIKTLEGDHHAIAGDYIIRGVNGELYPCKPDIFEKTYDIVEG